MEMRNSNTVMEASKNRVTLPKVILVVEHVQTLRASISSTLRGEDYFILAVSNGPLAFEVARDNPISLILFDPQYLQPSGFDICRLLRLQPETQHTPILFMITNEDERAQLESNGLRVDDYILKPLRWEELRACVRALLRSDTRNGKQRPVKVLPRPRAQEAEENGQILVIDDLSIDVEKRRVFRGNQPIELGSAILFDLLVYFVHHRGIVLTRERLLAHVWGYDSASANANNFRTIYVHVHWLRGLLEDDPDHPYFIETVRGVGYRCRD